jgi:glycosyltransferase involved in cell wall biosynthesis
MRILVVQESDWFDRGPLTSHHLLERLSKRGHEIKVIDYEKDWSSSKDRGLISQRNVFCGMHKVIKESSVIVIRPSIIRIPILNYFSLINTHTNEIRQQINEFKPDVIIGFGILNAYIAIHFAGKRNIPFIYYIMDELNQLVPQTYFRFLAKLIERKNMKNADKAISNSEGLRDYTIMMGAQKGKTDIIRSGVDVDHFKKSDDRQLIREKFGIDENDVVLFFMGLLYSYSGLKEVALELAKIENRNLKLMLLGKGDLWKELHDLKNRPELKDKIIIIDWVPYSEIPGYLAASDICILPAQSNDIMRNIVPIKMYEYMAAGKPVIATNLPGLIKEFGYNNGITYVNRPEDTLAKALELQGNNLINSEGIKSRRFVEEYGWDKLTDKFEDILNDAVAQH